MCRASNYAALLRKGLRDAGYPQVPGHRAVGPGHRGQPRASAWAIPHIHKAIQAFVIGDAIQSMLLRVRPYEATPRLRDGAVPHVGRLRAGVDHVGPRGRPGGRVSYGKLIRECVRAFDALPLRDIPAQAARRPRRRDPREVPPRRQQPRRRRHRGRGLRGRTARPHAVLPQLRGDRRVGQGETWASRASSATSCRSCCGRSRSTRSPCTARLRPRTASSRRTGPSKR